MISTFSPRRFSLGERRVVALFGNQEIHLQRQMEQKDYGQENKEQTARQHEKLTEARLGERMASTLKRFGSWTKERQNRLTQIQNRIDRTQKIAAMDHPGAAVIPLQEQQVKYETKAQFESRKRANTIADTLTGGSLFGAGNTETRAHGPEIRTVNVPSAVNVGGEQQSKGAPGAADQPGAKLAVESGNKKTAQEQTAKETGVQETQIRRTA